MTEKLKCPFCGAELENELNFWDKPTNNYFCPNEKCKIHDKDIPESVWTLAISAKKAQDALKSIADDAFLYHPSISEKIPWEEHYYRLKDKAKSAITSITKDIK